MNVLDQEIEAINDIIETLLNLDHEARERILRYVTSWVESKAKEAKSEQ